jgi:Asp/Glu/hydantoin racemase
MKLTVVYTSTTPELIATVEAEIRRVFGDKAELASLSDASILAETRDAGFVTAGAASRLISLYMDAVRGGADAILNACSSVGEAADAAQDIARYIGVPIVRIDEEMCREAVRTGKRIAVVATLPTTLSPTKNTILRVARELSRGVELVDVLVEGAFGLDQDQFKAKMLEYCEPVASKVDVILFAQGSMAYCEELVAAKTGKSTLSSPRFGAAALGEAMIKKGLL